MIEIFHISDLHFGFSTAKASELITALNKRFAVTSSPHKYLLVTGDITQSGTRKQYERALRSLEPFKGRIFFVPGNHDYGNVLGAVYDDHRARDFDDYFAGKLDEEQRYYDKKPYIRPLSEGEGNKVLLIGLNSCLKFPRLSMKSAVLGAFGLVGHGQLRVLEDTLARERYAHVPKLIFLHHIPHRMTPGLFMDLLDWPDLLDVAAKAVDIFAFGHEGMMEEPLDAGRRRRFEASRRMGVRTERAGHSDRTYFLDANHSVDDKACYHIKIENGKIQAPRKINLV